MAECRGIRKKLEAERKNMSRSHKYSNPAQCAVARGTLEFGELRKIIEDELNKNEQESNRDQEEIVRLNKIAKDFLVYVQGYLHFNPDFNLDFMTYKDRTKLIGATKQDLERNFILPGVSQSIEKISLLPEFQAWLTQFKLKELRVEVSRDSINGFSKYISNSKSKLALTSVEKIESANLSNISLENHRGAHEYHIRRCDFILQLPEFDNWKLKQAA